MMKLCLTNYEDEVISALHLLFCLW